MAVRLRMPVVIDATLLAEAFAIATRAGSELKIEPCYQIRSGLIVVEVDTHNEVIEFAKAQAGERRSDEASPTLNQESRIPANTDSSS